MKSPKSYTELIFFRGDMAKDGAVLRMNEIKTLMRAAAELNGLQFQEDTGTYALFGPTEKMHAGTDMAAAVRSKVLSKVDLCGYFSAAESAQKAQVVTKLCEEQALTFGMELIISRANEMLMQDLFSIKEWSA